jgi:hypothetical protein
MVQMSDEQWTMEAMHLASAMARNLNGRISLLRLVLANNPGLLGWGIAPPTTEEQRQIEEYAAVAEDYGVEFSVQPMQFITLADALAQVVALNEVSILFAHIRQSKLPLFRRFQLWSLKRQLGNCRLYTLGEEQPLTIDEPVLSAAASVETPVN